MEILTITVPIFIMLAIGYVSRKKGLAGGETRNFLSKFVYYIAFPALTFRSILSFDFARTFRLDLVAHNLSVTSIVFLLTFFTAYLIKDPCKRGAFHMGCFRSNQGYMGLPAVKGFYGDEAMSKAAVMNGFDSPAVIVLSVIALEIFRGKNRKGTDVHRGAVGLENNASGLKRGAIVAARKLYGVLVNPFMFTSVLGLALSYFKVPVLEISILDEILRILSNMALPLALVTIGCSVEIRHFRENIRLVLATSFIKLLGMPVIAFLLAYFFFGFRGADLGVSVILLSMPSSVSSYVMACEMDADEEVMASIVGFTTFISVFSVSVIQCALKGML